MSTDLDLAFNLLTSTGSYTCTTVSQFTARQAPELALSANRHCVSQAVLSTHIPSVVVLLLPQVSVSTSLAGADQKQIDPRLQYQVLHGRPSCILTSIEPGDQQKSIHRPWKERSGKQNNTALEEWILPMSALDVVYVISFYVFGCYWRPWQYIVEETEVVYIENHERSAGLRLGTTPYGQVCCSSRQFRAVFTCIKI